MQKRDAISVADPRHVPETFINLPIRCSLHNGVVMLTLGVERPLRSSRGAAPNVEREVAVRLVMPASAAHTIIEALQHTLSEYGQTLRSGPPN